MSITATELEENLNRYLLFAEKEDVYITRNGKVAAKLTNPYQNRVDMAKTLFGILPEDITLEDARKERLDNIDTPTVIKSQMPVYSPIEFLELVKRE